MIYNGKKVFEDTPSAADSYRQNYVDGIEKYIARKNKESEHIRDVFMSKISLIENIEIYRKEFCDMIGLSALDRENQPAVEHNFIGSDDVSDIYRLSVHITPEIPMYALLFLPKSDKPLPLVIAQHGGNGTPELCSDLIGKNNYKNMVRRLLERGAAVIAPQLLLWSTEEGESWRAHKIPFDRSRTDARLKRFGASITALEISGIMRCIDYASSLDEIDENKIAMIGMSYGGYFTLHTMASDTRIKAGYVGCAFNDRNVYDWCDWCYNGSAEKFHDAEIAALCAPRRLYISVGKQDSVFDYRHSLNEGERAKKYYEILGVPDNIRFSIWDGGHTPEDSDVGYDFIFETLI